MLGFLWSLLWMLLTSLKPNTTKSKFHISLLKHSLFYQTQLLPAVIVFFVTSRTIIWYELQLLSFLIMLSRIKVLPFLPSVIFLVQTCISLHIAKTPIHGLITCFDYYGFLLLGFDDTDLHPPHKTQMPRLTFFFIILTIITSLNYSIGLQFYTDMSSSLFPYFHSPSELFHFLLICFITNTLHDASDTNFNVLLSPSPYSVSWMFLKLLTSLALI